MTEHQAGIWFIVVLAVIWLIGAPVVFFTHTGKEALVIKIWGEDTSPLKRRLRHAASWPLWIIWVPISGQ